MDLPPKRGLDEVERPAAALAVLPLDDDEEPLPLLRPDDDEEDGLLALLSLPRRLSGLSGLSGFFQHRSTEWRGFFWSRMMQVGRLCPDPDPAPEEVPLALLSQRRRRPTEAAALERVEALEPLSPTRELVRSADPEVRVHSARMASRSTRGLYRSRSSRRWR